MEKIIKKIQNSVIDHAENNIEYKLTKVKNFYILHIHNPLSDNVSLYDYNKSFFNKFVNALFERDFDNKDRGCFNHEADDNSYKYNLDDKSLLNNYLSLDFTFILLDENIEPLCSFSVSNNLICNLCTNIIYRKNGYMTIFLKHFLKLVKLNKIKDLDYNSIHLKIIKINPLRDMLIDFYKSFNFKIYDDKDEYIHMQLN